MLPLYIMSDYEETKQKMIDMISHV